MSPLLAKLLIPLLIGTSTWSEQRLFSFLEKIEYSFVKEEITIEDVSFILDAYNT